MSAIHPPVTTVHPPDLVVGNHFNKYASRNPLVRWLVNGFIQSVRSAIAFAAADSVVDVGCADGELAARIIPQELSANYLGVDISPREIEKAAAKHVHLQFRIGSAYSLPVAADSVDLALALEVMEHLERPAEAIAELTRVTRRWAIVSVPWEPTWRILNMARGAYLPQFGNTPGHVQHFSRSGIRSLVQADFQIVREYRPLPWTILLMEKRNRE